MQRYTNGVVEVAKWRVEMTGFFVYSKYATLHKTVSRIVRQVNLEEIHIKRRVILT